MPSLQSPCSTPTAVRNANKQLIEIFEQKIKDRIAKVWGEKKKEYVEEDEVWGMVAEDEDFE